jgi:hypothetical protein
MTIEYVVLAWVTGMLLSAVLINRSWESRLKEKANSCRRLALGNMLLTIREDHPGVAHKPFEERFAEAIDGLPHWECEIVTRQAEDIAERVGGIGLKDYGPWYPGKRTNFDYHKAGREESLDKAVYEHMEDIEIEELGASTHEAAG